MGVLAGCRAEYDRYLEALGRARAALAEGDLPQVVEAVAAADRSLTAMAGLVPAMAALRRSADGSAAEFAELEQLAARARGEVHDTIAALRLRQASALAELDALATPSGPYAETALAGGCLLDRIG